MLWKKMQCYFGMDSACSHCPGAFAECTVACENTRLQLTVNLCHSFFIIIFCPWQFSRADFQESIKHAEQVVVTTIWLSFVHICRSISESAYKQLQNLLCKCGADFQHSSIRNFPVLRPCVNSRHCGLLPMLQQNCSQTVPPLF
ncbi:hypothetical protein T05_432 [Trichinella murrelli]|uniref:Uncharacterized protein n=1 Tax=Trichinella murrelli TaxID=144512 RepID=A0A0V0TR89_9BILA|nr:hypothetical protein T05_432 [Trichinella murrelli]